MARKPVVPQQLPALSVRDVAVRLNVHTQTIYEAVWRGELPAFKVGNVLRILPEDLDRFIAAAKRPA